MAIRAIPICLSHGFWTRRVIKLGWERRQTGGVPIHTSVVLVHSFTTIFAHTNGNVVSARDARRHQRDQTRIHKRRRQASSHVISDYSAHLYLPTDVPHDQLFPFVPSDHRSLRIVRRHQPQLDARRALHWGLLPRTSRRSAASHSTLRLSDPNALYPATPLAPIVGGRL
jgi:hypothetical protein